MLVKERRRELLKLICYRRFETRENLAIEFGVSMRTIDYNISELSLDYLIYTVQGKGGGVYVAEWYKLDQEYISAKYTDVLQRLLCELKGERKEVLQFVLDKFGSR